MVKSAGAAPGAGAIRPLNLPEPIQVEEGSGWPLALQHGAALDPLASAQQQPSGFAAPRAAIALGATRIASMEDVWRVEEEWWRSTSISRTYFEVLLEDGRRVSIFHDHASGEWYRQHYG